MCCCYTYGFLIVHKYPYKCGNHIHYVLFISILLYIIHSSFSDCNGTTFSCFVLTRHFPFEFKPLIEFFLFELIKNAVKILVNLVIMCKIIKR